MAGGLKKSSRCFQVLCVSDPKNSFCGNGGAKHFREIQRHNDPAKLETGKSGDMEQWTERKGDIFFGGT